jgi:hypothetical protein
MNCRPGTNHHPLTVRGNPNTRRFPVQPAAVVARLAQDAGTLTGALCQRNANQLNNIQNGLI